MTVAFNADSLPLREDENGTIRVGKTRVTLDTVIAAFNSGYSPEEIVVNFDTLELADVYSLIGYYLKHKREVDTYLEKRSQEAQEIENLLSARQDHSDLRNRLMARKQAS